MRTQGLIWLFCGFILLAQCGSDTSSENIQRDFPMDTTWKALSLREQIGQTMMLTASKDLYKQKGFENWESFFERYPVGGFFMAPWTLLHDIPDSLKRTVTENFVRLYQSKSKTPLFIVEDYEGGLGHSFKGFTKIPTGMALGATQNPELSYRVGSAIGEEASLIGYNWLLHPVADLSLNELNPVTNVRSVSSNPTVVIQHLTKQIKGLQSHQIAATSKHFPGDGASDLDQHLTTTINSLSEKDWYASYGKTFKTLIDEGVYTIMTGHIAFPAYTKHNDATRHFPATLSHTLTTTLLKEEMGFKGVVVSDALNMAGIQGYYPNQLETEIASFKAGTDVMLWPDLAFMDSVEARILRNEIPLERLHDAVQRVWNLKKKLGLLEFRMEEDFSDDLEKKIHFEASNVAKEVAKSSITLTHGASLLPLSPEKDKTILVVVVAPDKHTWSADAFQAATERLKEAGFSVEVKHNLSYYGNSPTDQLKYDRILFFYARQPHNPIGSLQLQHDEALTAWMVNQLPKEKIIGVSFGDPYVLARYNPGIGVRINAYQQTEVVQHAVMDVLLGHEKAVGISPVTLSR